MLVKKVFLEYSNIAPEGKVRGKDSSGFPCWVDLPLPTRQEQIETAKAEIKRRFDEVNTYINYHQWPSKVTLGRLSALEMSIFNKALSYLDELINLDASTAPDIMWPTILFEK